MLTPQRLIQGGGGPQYIKHGKHSSEILKKTARDTKIMFSGRGLNFFSPLRGKKVKCAYETIVAHQAGAYPCFCSMTCLGVFLLPCSISMMGVFLLPSQGCLPSIKFSGTHLYTMGGEMHCESKVSCPRTQHNVPGQGSNPDRSVPILKQQSISCHIVSVQCSKRYSKGSYCTPFKAKQPKRPQNGCLTPEKYDKNPPSPRPIM